MPDFNEVYVRGNKCIASNKRRTRCGLTNVSKSKERDEVKPWDEKTEEGKVLHRFCTGHRKDKRRGLTERVQSPHNTIPSTSNVQAQNPFLSNVPAQVSQPYQPTYVSNPLPPLQHTAATSEVNISATETQSRSPPLPPQHAALYGSYSPLWRDGNRYAPRISETLNDLLLYSQSARSEANREIQNSFFSLLTQLSYLTDAEVKQQIADLEAEEVARNRGYINSETGPPGSRIHSNSRTGLAESFNIPVNYHPLPGQDSQPLGLQNSPAPASYRPTVAYDRRCTTCRRFESKAFELLHTKINRNICSFFFSLQELPQVYYTLLSI